MESFHFLRGLAIGLALAAPVGPVGILCIRRALADGRHAAFVAGMGAAFADTFYGAVAALGLTVISSFLIDHAFLLRLVGGSFLVLLGAHTFRVAPICDTGPAAGPGLAKDFVSTFLITLSNPATILASMGVFAAIGALDGRGTGNPRWVIIGVFAGSTLWWLTLSAVASAVRSRFTPAWLSRLNRVSGTLLVVFGCAILASLAVNHWG